MAAGVAGRGETSCLQCAGRVEERALATVERDDSARVAGHSAALVEVMNGALELGVALADAAGLHGAADIKGSERSVVGHAAAHLRLHLGA